ncbi:hypothetical protein C7R54_06565 [Achromobacter aloeverae]|uniref:Uncharacterized protein n=2 Tax=Achromobacter aloeverae TaxID=1750518 RepID=A0A4V1MSV4_9BURK|nr:hypothetical protein C7R54_06565 [Achromobacter aloeverae]
MCLAPSGNEAFESYGLATVQAQDQDARGPLVRAGQPRAHRRLARAESQPLASAYGDGAYARVSFGLDATRSAGRGYPAPSTPGETRFRIHVRLSGSGTEAIAWDAERRHLFYLLPQPQTHRGDAFVREPYTFERSEPLHNGAFGSPAEYRVLDVGRRCAVVGRPDARFELAINFSPAGEPVSSPVRAYVAPEARLGKGLAWYAVQGRPVGAITGIGCCAYPLVDGAGEGRATPARPPVYTVIADWMSGKSEPELARLMLRARGRSPDEVRDLVNGRKWTDIDGCMRAHEWGDIQRETLSPSLSHGQVRQRIRALLDKPGVDSVMVQIGVRAFVLDAYARADDMDGAGAAAYLIHLYQPRSGDVHTIRDHAELWMGDGTRPGTTPVDDAACYFGNADLDYALLYVDTSARPSGGGFAARAGGPRRVYWHVSAPSVSAGVPAAPAAPSVPTAARRFSIERLLAQAALMEDLDDPPIVVCYHVDADRRPDHHALDYRAYFLGKAMGHADWLVVSDDDAQPESYRKTPHQLCQLMLALKGQDHKGGLAYLKQYDCKWPDPLPSAPLPAMSRFDLATEIRSYLQEHRSIVLQVGARAMVMSSGGIGEQLGRDGLTILDPSTQRYLATFGAQLDDALLQLFPPDSGDGNSEEPLYRDCMVSYLGSVNRGYESE